MNRALFLDIVKKYGKDRQNTDGNIMLRIKDWHAASRRQEYTHTRTHII